MWEYHDKTMKKLKTEYNKLGKQRISEISNILSLNIDKDNLYEVATSNNKKKLNTKIETLKDEGLLVGIIGAYLLSLYNKKNLTNNELIKAYIYTSYLEEDNKANEIEQKHFYDDSNYYYQEALKEKKSHISILDVALFTVLMNQVNYSGMTWNELKQATINYNAEQIYKKVILDIQQEKELDFYSADYQKVFETQDKAKLNIKDNKISGMADLHMIGLNNEVKLKAYGEDSQVVFIAVEDDKTTGMCQSLNGQIFNVKGENEFYREYGETPKELRQVKIKCKGLVLGLNLPPINHHFHYCRSTIIYNINYKRY